MAMTQHQKVLKHLEEFGTITPLDALREYSIMRLSAIIFDLRKDGYEIVTVMQEGYNKFGERTRWAEYRMVDYGECA